MSGGSFNYLCHTWDFDALASKQGDLEAMSRALAELGYAKDAARETEELLVMLRQWENQAIVRVERLREVWKAVEWWRSSDYSEDDVKEALAEYRAVQPQVDSQTPEMTIDFTGALTAAQRAEVIQLIREAARRAAREGGGRR